MQTRQHRPTPRPTSTSPRRSAAAVLALLLSLLMLLVMVGCKNGGAGGPGASLDDLDEAITLPGLGGDEAPVERGRVPRIIVQRMDVPLNQPLDTAWTHIDEQAFPAITRGAWHANGLRIGLLHEPQVADFAKQVPQIVNFFEKNVITRNHPVAIMQAAPLRPDTQFAIDLTLPPSPPSEMVVSGRQGGQLQLLARLELDGDRTFVILTPHLYRPKPNDFSNRPLLERDLDGQVFHELAIRVELKPDRLIAIGLYWPWPGELPGGPGEPRDSGVESDEPGDDEEPGEDTDAPESTQPPRGEVVVDNRGREELSALDSVLTTNDGALDDDPAAPPQRVRTTPPSPTPPQPNPDAQPDPEQAMPPLPMHFGRVLLTGTRARRPVQTMLLISIPPAAPAEGEVPADEGAADADGDE